MVSANREHPYSLPVTLPDLPFLVGFFLPEPRALPFQNNGASQPPGDKMVAVVLHAPAQMAKLAGLETGHCFHRSVCLTGGVVVEVWLRQKQEQQRLKECIDLVLFFYSSPVQQHGNVSRAPPLPPC